jgi:thiamine-monophosphate kinase
MVVKTEFDLINYIKKSFGPKAIGDDCAVLPGGMDSDLLITADLLIEDIDFRLATSSAVDLGHKALAVSLSDIAAMGGRPSWALLTLGIPRDLWETSFVEQFYAGWNALASEFQVELVGGDISRSPDKLVIDSIVAGYVPKGSAVLRSGANIGDAIFVSGSLGGAAGGLKLLENSASANDAIDQAQRRLIERQLRPGPRIALGQRLREQNIATSMIDLSDGLSSDLHHICEASGVGARIEPGLLPLNEDVVDMFGADEALKLALNGGEDFELLFTVSRAKIAFVPRDSATRIGTITEITEGVKLIDAHTSVDLQPSGYRHF